MDVLLLLWIWLWDGFPLVFETLQFTRIESLRLVLVQTTPGPVYMIRYSMMPSRSGSMRGNETQSSRRRCLTSRRN